MTDEPNLDFDFEIEDLLEGIAAHANKAFDGLPLNAVVEDGEVVLRWNARCFDMPIEPDDNFLDDPLLGMEHMGCSLAHIASNFATMFSAYAMYLDELAVEHARVHHGYDPVTGLFPDGMN